MSIIFTIPNEIYEALLTHAQSEKPLEVCGLVGGTIENGLYQAVKYYPMTNADKSSESFQMVDKEQFAVNKNMRLKGLELISVFHSHPRTQAYPSATDVKNAYYPFNPEVLYMILSLKENKPALRAFTIINQSIINEVEVRIQK